MTFEGSGDCFDPPNGTLATGWTVSIPPVTSGSSKALVGANAVVYAAGAGPLGNTAAAATLKVTTNREDPELKITSEIEGLRGRSAMAAKQQVRNTIGVDVKTRSILEKKLHLHPIINNYQSAY